MLALIVIPPVSKDKCNFPLLARAISYVPLGLDALRVDVEVDVARGLPTLTIVGLPDQAVREARDRVRAAITNSQFRLPSQRLTINLAPADVKKEGGVFDLAIALGILAASHQLPAERVAACVALGELALDGTVRPVPGILPIALSLARQVRRPLLVPQAAAAQAASIPGLEVIPVATLQQAADYLRGTWEPAHSPRPRRSFAPPHHAVDFAELKGQAHAKRAVEIAVAGGHHLLLIGPPGAGKTMLAQRIPTILPPWSREQALTTAAVYSAAGLLPGDPLRVPRPFRAPHHTSSAAALMGGGPSPRPGEISLAHEGVLFLDELPEFRRDVLESLRQPLEEGCVRIARAKRSVTFPARFLLVGAMNPCPCGHLTDSRGRCRCPSTAVARYLAKISGPLLDRIDLHIDVPAVPFDALTHAPSGETSAHIRARVLKARRWCRRRGQQRANAQLGSKELKAYCEMTPEAVGLLKSAMRDLALSARSYTKILKISRTIADLAESATIQSEHIAEAIQYRSLDRQLWA